MAVRPTQLNSGWTCSSCPEDAWAQHARVVDQLGEHGLADAAQLLSDAATDILADTALPKAA
jgi:hypothetical protein